MPLANIKQNIDEFVNNRLQDMPIHMKYKETEQHFFMDFHSHEGYEIYFFHEGEGCFLVEDHIFPLQGNDLILRLVLRGVLYKQESPPPSAVGS